MATFLVQLRRSGPEWDPALPLREQPRFAVHAAFIDRLVHEERLILVGGPLADEERVVYLVRASSEDEARERVVEADPWSGTHLVLESIDGWTLLLDGLGAGH
jgi:uncharacterized protein YciI